MSNRKRSSFSEQTNELGEKNLVPMLPLSLQFQNPSIQEWGLLDTGAAVNVLPYRMGLALGLKKETQKTPVQLKGILAQVPAYGVLQKATIDEFPPVKLVFAWTEAENIPLILGRMNFLFGV